MAGRHAARHSHDAHTHGTPRRTGRVVRILVAVVLVLAGGGATVRALQAHSHNDSEASACSGEVSLSVIAAPTVQPAVSAIAHRWNASYPSVQGRCIHAVVTGRDSAVETRALASNTGPALWIPDSSLWGEKLAATSPALAKSVKVDASIGSSPLVLAAPPGKAAAIGQAAKSGWAAALAGPAPVTVTDPTTTAPGALMVLGLSTQSATVPGDTAKLVGLFMRMQSALLPDATAGMTALQTRPASAPAFVASEQEVFLENRGKAAPIASAVYPSGPTPMLNFPMVRVTPPGSDRLVTAAMAKFERQLGTRAARTRLAAVGLRDPAGAPLPADSPPGVSPRAVKPAPATLTPQQVTTAMRLWSAAAKPSQLLAVIDVSGSMAASAGDGKSKIDVVSQAAETAMSVVPDNWTVGLWTFSYHSPPQTDWTELVPLGPVKTQRRTITGEATTLADRVGGNTALYDTALAAFQDVSAHYDPSSVNVVALLTDGTDVDPDGIGLHALLGRLTSEYNPAKPVHIVTIGFGKDADANALERISAATHGQSYMVKNSKDIVGVVLDSIIANNI
jgi:Ca-activated chloride channel homolog